jgi:hypothetical protein
MKNCRKFFISFGLTAAGLMFGSAVGINAQDVKTPADTPGKEK